MSERPDIAFKILDRAEWEAARSAGRYGGSAVDLQDGYIHLSTEAQLGETVRRHYAGRRNLALLTVDLSAVDVTWEASRGGDLFPHLYGDLPVSAVRAERHLSVDADGTMIFDEPTR